MSHHPVRLFTSSAGRAVALGLCPWLSSLVLAASPMPEQTRDADASAADAFRQAHSTVEADVLPLPRVEQGLENFKCVAAAAADPQIEPGQGPGTSDLVIRLSKAKPRLPRLTADDSCSNREIAPIGGGSSHGCLSVQFFVAVKALGLDRVPNLWTAPDLKGLFRTEKPRAHFRKGGPNRQLLACSFRRT